MNILDELQEAKNEFIQEEWDKTLINLWKTRPNDVMGYVIAKFIEDYKITPNDFFKLNRIPKSTRQQRTRITRFIAAYLPVLSTHLWNNNKTQDELLKICINIRTMWNPSDSFKAAAEFQEKRKQENEYRKAQMENHEYLNYKERINRSNWGAAKK